MKKIRSGTNSTTYLMNMKCFGATAIASPGDSHNGELPSSKASLSFITETIIRRSDTIKWPHIYIYVIYAPNLSFIYCEQANRLVRSTDGELCFSKERRKET